MSTGSGEVMAILVILFILSHCLHYACQAPVAQSVAHRTKEQGVAGTISCSINFFPRIDDSYCDKIGFFFTADNLFHDGHVGKQLMAWKEDRAVH